MQLLASLAAALCLVLVPTSEAAPAPSPQFPADLLVYAAIGKYILGTGVGIGKSAITTIFIKGSKEGKVFLRRRCILEQKPIEKGCYYSPPPHPIPF